MYDYIGEEGGGHAVSLLTCGEDRFIGDDGEGSLGEYIASVRDRGYTVDRHSSFEVFIKIHLKPRIGSSVFRQKGGMYVYATEAETGNRLHGNDTG